MASAKPQGVVHDLSTQSPEMICRRMRSVDEWVAAAIANIRSTPSRSLGEPPARFPSCTNPRCQNDIKKDMRRGVMTTTGVAVSVVTAQRCDLSVVANCCVTPGVAAISSMSASRIHFTLPNFFNNAFFRFGPIPGTESSALCMPRRERKLR